MLPSQSPRPVGLRTSVSRSRRRGLPIARIVIVLGLIVGGWFAIKAILPVGETKADMDGRTTETRAQRDGSGGSNSASASMPDSDVGDRSRNANPSDDDGGGSILAMAEHSTPTVATPNFDPAEGDGSNPAADAADIDSDAGGQRELIMGGANLPDPPPTTTDDREEATTPGGNTSMAPSPSALRTAERVQKGLDLIKANRLVDARLLLSRALASGSLSRTDAQYVRETLSDLNDRLIFSREIVPGDEYCVSYTIAGGDSLERIVKRMALQVDWRFIQRINGIKDPRSIRQGDRLKLITGPFHAVVDKSDYTMDLYLGEGDAQVYVRTFPVGLGEFNSTPVGLFRIRPRSKLVNPEWINPRTRERYAADDPNNPIGEHWLGLEGISDAVQDVSGYGIHGTIEPESIGRQASMGCVRMHADDVELIYEVLIEGASTVRIQD